MAFVSNRRICIFCENSEQKINYKEFKTLRKFITDQGKISGKNYTRACNRSLCKTPETSWQGNQAIEKYCTFALLS